MILLLVCGILILLFNYLGKKYDNPLKDWEKDRLRRLK